jgi:arsenical pump membrane protein
VRTAVLGAALLGVGLVALIAGVLTLEELRTLVERVAPVLGFVVALTIVSELAAEAGLFSWLAGFAARAARGRVVVLWAFVVVLALGCTIFLSLDTTAVLLTPVVVLVARRVGLPPMPFALTTVWLANCGSMLLPVSNLTNLLALDALGSPSPASFAALAAEAPAREEAGDRVLFVVAAVAVALLVPALVSGIEVWIPAAVAALVLVVVTAVRRPSTLRLGLVPWGTIVFASGLFVVVEAAHSLGLADALAVLVGSGDGLPDLLRLAAGSAAAANVANNLPAYVGCLVAPWASLATLLWHGRLSSMGVEVKWGGVVLGGLGVAVVAVPLAVVATVLVGP